MKAWIARDKKRLGLFNAEPYWSKVGKCWCGAAAEEFTYPAFRREFPGVTVRVNTKQPITLTAAPLGPAVQGGE